MVISHARWFLCIIDIICMASIPAKTKKIVLSIGIVSLVNIENVECWKRTGNICRYLTSQLARSKATTLTRSLPLLRSLHWLPVRFRILFKIKLLTYKTLREKQPVYLHSMLATLIPSRSLISNNDNSLSVPRVKTNTGARDFHSWALSLWNNLPLSLRSVISVATFKKYLKAYLFDLAFPP